MIHNMLSHHVEICIPRLIKIRLCQIKLCPHNLLIIPGIRIQISDNRVLRFI